MKRPMHIIQTYWPIKEMPTPMARVMLRYKMRRRRGNDRNLEQAKAPVAAPAILID